MPRHSRPRSPSGGGGRYGSLGEGVAGLNAPRLLFFLGVVLGSALAVDSVLTRGGQRLAKQAEIERRATVYTDSGGNNLPVSTPPKDSDAVRAGVSIGMGSGDGARWSFLGAQRCPLHLAAVGGVQMHCANF